MGLKDKQGKRGHVILLWQNEMYIVILNGMEFERHPELIHAIRCYERLANHVG